MTKASNTMHLTITLLVVLGLMADVHAQEVRILSPTPVGEHSCVAAPLDLSDGAVLTGIRWIHNDATTNFPRLLIVEGEPGIPPDLAATGVVLVDLAGATLGWGQVDLAQQVTSSTGFAYAVFVYPANEPTTGVGEEGGAGLGVVEAPQPYVAHMSPDGISWVTLGKHVGVSVEPVIASGLARSSAGMRTIGELSGAVDYAKVLGLSDKTPPITRTELLVPRPNPFNPRTTLEYTLLKAGRVALRIYDVRGRLVRTLVDEARPMGRHVIVWEGIDNRSRDVASGVYFARFESGDSKQTQRMVLVR